MLTEHSRSGIADILQDPQTFGTCLLALLLDQYGTEVMEWEPVTVQMALKAEFNTAIPPENFDKVNALIAALTSDTFYRDPIVFTHVCDALSGLPVNMEMFTPVSPEAAAWGITEVLLNEDHQDMPQFTDEVRRYLGVCLEEAGVSTPPDVLKLASYRPDFADTASEHTEADPDMEKAIGDKSREQSTQITALVKGRMGELIEQLHHLPLEHRDHESWNAFLGRSQS